jgi:hypothetical protein
MKNHILLQAAVAGILGAALPISGHAAPAADQGATLGQCIGANSCKGKSDCHQAGMNECKGENGCKGKGYLEKTKADCDKLALKNKRIHFEAAD